jgi:hypothetical protein
LVSAIHGVTVTSKRIINVTVERFMRVDKAKLQTELEAAWASPWGLLWTYGLLSQDYFTYLEGNKTTLDARLADQCFLFGDCRQCDFIDWWEQFGRSISGIDVTSDIKILTKMDQIGDTGLELSEWIYLKVPAFKDASRLQAAFAEILRTHELRTPQALAAKELEGQNRVFKLNEFKGLDYEVMRKAAEVWLEHQLDVLGKKSGITVEKNKPLTLWELGEKLNVSVTQRTSESEDQDVTAMKRNAMKVAVSRMLKRADSLIANVEVGIFPSYEPVEVVERWNNSLQINLGRLNWPMHLRRVKRQIQQINEHGFAILIKQKYGHLYK